MSVEIYDISLVFRWRASPEPDISLAFPGESAELERDLAELEGWAAVDLRKKAEHKLRMRRLYRFNLTDDVGTNYFQQGHRHGGGGGVMSGETEFRPSPPPIASSLGLSWLNLHVPMPLN